MTSLARFAIVSGVPSRRENIGTPYRRLGYAYQPFWSEIVYEFHGSSAISACNFIRLAKFCLSLHETLLININLSLTSSSQFVL